jgi:hypothetical protein
MGHKIVQAHDEQVVQEVLDDIKINKAAHVENIGSPRGSHWELRRNSRQEKV